MGISFCMILLTHLQVMIPDRLFELAALTLSWATIETEGHEVIYIHRWYQVLRT